MTLRVLWHVYYGTIDKNDTLFEFMKSNVRVFFIWGGGLNTYNTRILFQDVTMFSTETTNLGRPALSSNSNSL